MAVKFQFKSKTVIEPGAYGRFVSGVPERPTTASFGNVMIIDTGVGRYFGNGGGVNGELTNKKDSIYEFEDGADFKNNFVNGGLFWDLVDYLFAPSSNGVGVQKLMYVSAKTSTAPTCTYTVSGVSGGASLSVTISGGAIISINILNGGSGFSSPPSISFSNAGGGTGASATAVLTGGVITSITSLVGGTGYGVNTTVVVTGSANGGTLTLKSKTEGIAGNGYLVGSNLAKGVATKLIAGKLDSTKFIMQFYIGTFRGVNISDTTFVTPDWIATTTYTINTLVYYGGFVFKALLGTNLNQNPFTANTYWALQTSSSYYNNTDPSTSAPKLLVESSEFSTLSELFTWMGSDYSFSQNFALSSSNIVGTGVVDSTDLASNNAYKVFTGGTESYSSSDLDAVLAEITEEDNTFFLCDNWGDNAQSVNNTKILGHMVNDAEADKFMFVGGGNDASKFTQPNGSIPTAKYYDSEKVITVHSGIQMPKQGGGTKILPSIYNAAMTLGRIAGLEPQTSGTWKNISISGLVHELNKKDRERALQAGVIHHKYVDGIGWVINQAINSLQKNTQLINPDGRSYEISIERIKAQLNKELIANAKLKFVGGNLRTSSAGDVKAFTETYLKSRTASIVEDNLIISYKSVKVTLQDEAWFVSYGFVANSPINKLFFTGTLLDANINI